MCLTVFLHNSIQVLCGLCLGPEPSASYSIVHTLPLYLDKWLEKLERSLGILYFLWNGWNRVMWRVTESDCGTYAAVQIVKHLTVHWPLVWCILLNCVFTVYKASWNWQVERDFPQSMLFSYVVANLNYRNNSSCSQIFLALNYSNMPRKSDCTALS